jgi:hypothetical protein
MKRYALVFSVLIFLSAGAFAVPTTAQNDKPSSVLTGIVYDFNGAVITGSRVILYGLDGSQFDAVTDSEGVYKIQAPPAVYTVVATAPGFCLKRISRFRVISTTSGKLSLDLVLDVADERKPCAIENMPARRPANKNQKKPRAIAE